MFPWFAFGHISPFIQLANKLSLHGGNVRISFFSAPGNIPRISTSLLSSPTTQIIPLPIPPVDGLPPGLDSTAELTPQLADLLKIAVDLMQPQVKELLIQLKPDFVFFDHFMQWLPGMGSELGIKTVSFTVFSAVSTGYGDKRALPPTGQLEDRWANWLGQFPTSSIIFCNFGSETFLTHEQIRELAYGLENTGLPFFLILNFPAQVDSQTELDRALPEGFLERVKDRGVVHTGWVQQPLILAHTSVGCYLNHSGFSSLIEGLINDCQLVLLPLKGDQFLNARLIVGDMKAGIEVDRRDEDGYFGRDDVTRAVKTIMADDADKEPVKSIRENHGKWKKFLLDDEAQNKYAKDLVAQLKAMQISA
ncbi:Anthocyanidin-3-O-glucoside rhamnosyltransferase [Linum perenne]